MVEGFSPMNTAFIDLDGTLIKGNSMKVFMKWLSLRLVLNRRPDMAIIAMWWMFLRVARLATHTRMKWNLTGIAKRVLASADWEQIADRILRRINPEVDVFVKSRKEKGEEICIATAAPAEYAEIIARKYGAKYVLATEYAPNISDYYENKGDRKLNAIRNLIDREGLALSAFLTDHHDDLPTMKFFPGKTILVNPSPLTRRLCKNIKYITT